MTEVTDKDLADALDRIARTPDGGLLYLYLQKTLTGVLAGEVPDWTLRRDHGRRLFAAELMAHMGEGISINGRPGSVTFVTAPRESGSRRAPGSRLVGPDTFVPGFSDPDREPHPDAGSSSRPAA